MPHYEYACNYCGFIQKDVYQKITDKPLEECPRCKHKTFERLISGGLMGFVKGEATTIGQLSERNTKKMGKYELQEKVLKEKDTKKEAMKEVRKEINKMTETQKRNFIENG